MNWIGRSEYAHHWTVEGNRKMHRAAAELCNPLAAPPIAFTPQDHHVETLFFKPLADFSESLWIPVLRLPYGTWNQCAELLQRILFEELLRGRLNLGGQINSGIDGGIVHAEHRCKPLIAIDCVDIERGNRNVM